MPANRSPNYPRIDLGDAIQRVRLIWDKEGRSKLHPEGTATILGYASYNGSAQGVISALRKYGLLTGKGDELTVSADALTILHTEKGSPERMETLRRAAFAPSLFQEIRKEFPDSLPSEENLKSRLIRHKGFSQDAATVAARNYRETMGLVAKETGGYNPTITDSAEEAEGDPMPSDPAPSASPVVPPIQRPSQAVSQKVAASVVSYPTSSESGLWLQVPFKGAALSVRIEIEGQALTKEHVARVRKYLEMAEEDLEAGGTGRATEPNGQE